MIQKINILDSSQSGVKNGADSEAVLAALIEHLELINPSGRLSQNTRSAMLQLREEEWSEFFFWLLNSLESVWINAHESIHSRKQKNVDE